MITIYCGNDISNSRRAFSTAREKMLVNGSEIKPITQNTLEEVLKSAISEQSLFINKFAYVAENILSKKKIRDIVLTYETNTNISLLIWEETMDPRSIKTYFKKSTIIVNDLPVSIWKLLDAIQPGRKIDVISSINSLSAIVDEHLMLYMIQKRIKELILIHKNFTGGKKMADWQMSKLKHQARNWQQDKLVALYTKLSAVEKAERVDSTPYSIIQALEILFCFYL